MHLFGVVMAATIIIMVGLIRSSASIDTDPPLVTCSNVTTLPVLPNSFMGLVLGSTFTYSDANPDPSGVTYNVSVGPFHDLFPPGNTPVSLIAVDIFGNKATCLFYVKNPLTELPVNCPNLNRNVSTDPGQATYTFISDFGVDDVTKSSQYYRYHGDISVSVTIDGSPSGSSVPIGIHEVAAIISDDVLTKTCRGYYNVQDTDPPLVTCSNVTTIPVLPNSFMGLDLGYTYTYSDANPDPSGVTYNVSIGPFHDLFPPGNTPVSLIAVDAFGNKATCLFYVENPLTELPVNCPNLNRNVSTDPGQATYTFITDFGVDDVTKSLQHYRYHGDISVSVTIDGSPSGSSVPIGIHEVAAIISDDVLTKTCRGYYNVQGN